MAWMLRCEGSGGEVFGGGSSGFPVGGEEFLEAVHGMGAEAGEEVVGENGNVRTRYLGQNGLDTAPRSGIMNGQKQFNVF